MILVPFWCPRYWRWGKDEGGRKDRNHIFEAGDSLAKVAKMYNISIADLVRGSSTCTSLR